MSTQLHESRPQSSAPCGDRSEWIENLTELRKLMPDWIALIRNGATGSNFYNDPKHVEIKLQSQPDATPRILVLRRGEKIRCIAPFYLCPGRFLLQFSVIKIGSFRARLAKVFGDDFIVASGEDPVECYDAIFQEIWQRRSHFEYIYLEQFVSTSPLWAYCHDKFSRNRRFRLSLASTQLEKEHQIHFPPKHNNFLSAISYETRRKMRRYTRKLCEEKHSHLVKITSADEIPRFLDAVDRVYQQSWQAKTFGYRPRNTEAESQYLTELSRHGWLRSYLLENEDGPIAFALGFQYENVYHFFETAYVQSWSEFTPGIVLMHLFFEDLFRTNPPKLLSFGAGDAAYKRSFSNVQIVSASIHLLLPNRWRRRAAIQRGLNAVERKVRSSLVRLKFDRAIRKLLKQQR